jgi:hypothetical protein
LWTGAERDNNAPVARLLHSPARFGAKSIGRQRALRRAGASARQIRKSLSLNRKIGFVD